MGFEHAHFKEVCTECKKVVAQCRCFHPWKFVRDTICDDCKGKQKVTDSAVNIGAKVQTLMEQHKLR